MGKFEGDFAFQQKHRKENLLREKEFQDGTARFVAGKRNDTRRYVLAVSGKQPSTPPRTIRFSPTYYETQTLDNALKPECMLALEMNGEPLPEIHGAPLRLRVENQLGYKMIKWIERIEFVESEKQLGKGEGGSDEDDEYFDLLPNI